MKVLLIFLIILFCSQITYAEKEDTWDDPVASHGWTNFNTAISLFTAV